jgi:peptide/nickel transport system ATP-binding protein
MLSLLDDLRQRFRLAMLYITHDIASARYFADEVLVMYAGEIVERGPAEEVTQQPAHPYTQLLVASAPDPDNLGSSLRSSAHRSTAHADSSRRQGSQTAQKPEGPAAGGCPFSPRCPFADDRCYTEDPPLMQISPSRGAACWHLDVAAPELVSALPGDIPNSANLPITKTREGRE